MAKFMVKISVIAMACCTLLLAGCGSTVSTSAATENSSITKAQTPPHFSLPKASSLISTKEISSLMQLKMVRNGPEQINPNGSQTGGTGCSWIATTKSLTGGVGSNVLITVERATQTLRELQSTLDTASTWHSVRVDGVSMIQSGESVYSILNGSQVAVVANFSSQPQHQVEKELIQVTAIVMKHLNN